MWRNIENLESAGVLLGVIVLTGLALVGGGTGWLDAQLASQALTALMPILFATAQHFFGKNLHGIITRAKTPADEPTPAAKTYGEEKEAEIRRELNMEPLKDE